MPLQKSEKIISYTRTLVHTINDFYIFIVLIVFYFLVLGITALFLKIATKIKGRETRGSYWQNMDKKKLNTNYFQSPY